MTAHTAAFQHGAFAGISGPAWLHGTRPRDTAGMVTILAQHGCRRLTRKRLADPNPIIGGLHGASSTRVP